MKLGVIVFWLVLIAFVAELDLWAWYAIGALFIFFILRELWAWMTDSYRPGDFAKGRSENSQSKNDSNKAHQELEEDRQEKLSQPLPAPMRKAFAEFEESIREDPFWQVNLQEVSPLKIFGYTVGKTNGLPGAVRREIIYFTWYATLPDWFPDDYLQSWGVPGTSKRYRKILKHLRGLADRHKGRRGHEQAVSEWRSDASWFRNRYGDFADKLMRYGI